MGKVLIGILAVFLLIGAFASAIMTGIHNWRTNDTTENFIVTTAAGVTTANITLANDLFQAATGEVISISSNITETAVATSYTEATKVLLLSALNADVSRTIVLRYYAETNDVVLRIIGPFLGFLIIGSLVALIFWAMFSKQRGGGRR